MRLDHLVLDLVSSFFFGLFLTCSAVFVQLFGVRLNLDDARFSAFLDLLEDAYNKDDINKL